MDQLRRIIKYILITIVLLVLVYSALFSIKVLKPGHVGLVHDKSSNKAVRLYTGKYNFVPEGMMPFWYLVYEIPLSRTIIETITIHPRALAKLDHQQYKINIPITISFGIDLNDPAATGFVLDNVGKVNEKVLKIATELFKKEVNVYLEPAYKRNQLLKNMQTIEKNVFNSLKTAMKNLGIHLTSIIQTGPVMIPEQTEYYNGIKHISELNKIEEEDENRLKKLKGLIERNELNDAQYYKKLDKISVLLKKNPDLIKYIYIDKLSDKIKVVPSINEIESLNSHSKEILTPSPKEGEIDNLR